MTQDSLLRKLYNVGIQGKVWKCISNLYNGATSSVKWQGLVSPPLIAHLWKVFDLPRMLYDLEVFCLRLKDVMQLKQVQRFFMKKIQCLPVNTATSAAYGLLGIIRPIQQELDLRKLT